MVLKQLDNLFSYSDIHFRDRWQFELKSEFFPHSSIEENRHTQEFYVFIPEALQVNEKSYSKEQFYLDQTNLIRYKTPQFTLSQLLDPQESLSPIYRLQQLLDPEGKSAKTTKALEDELKLFGNVFRSSLRTRVQELSEKLSGLETHFEKESEKLILELERFNDSLLELKELFRKAGDELLPFKHFEYIEGFLYDCIELYLTYLIELIREKREASLEEIDRKLCNLLLALMPHKLSYEKKILKKEEYLIYQKSLLNKYVLDALLLRINRFSPRQKYQNIVGAVAAGIAMFVYLVLFVLQGEIFLINSWPFILITVIIYILKDRLKDNIKNLSHSFAFDWFPDYTTVIKAPNGEHVLGRLKETVNLMRADRIPQEIEAIRNREFHEVLEAFHRPETVIHYKKTIIMHRQKSRKNLRRFMLNILFRFNIEQFLKKASNPYELHLRLDPKSLRLIKEKLPKVYHLNIILINTFLSQEGGAQKKELKKFRLIVDKNGLRRVEHL